jgi:Glycosyl transferases group 1
MKILFVGNFARGWDGSVCDEVHIANALEKFGHTVVRQQRETGWDEALPNVDLVLIAQWDGYPEDIFSDVPIPVIYWAFDFQADGQEWHERLIKKSDVYLSKALSDSKYPNWRWLSQDFAPEFLDRNELADKTIDVLFTGTFLPWAEDRIKFLKIADENFNLVIHSVNPGEWAKAGFKNVNGPVMDEGLPDLYSKAKINLSIDHTITPGYWSDRNAQIMACGGFVLFRYIPMSEVRFRDYIFYFNDTFMYLEAIKYFLEHDDKRDQLADAGYKYAQSSLMTKHRVRDLITILDNI